MLYDIYNRLGLRKSSITTLLYYAKRCTFIILIINLDCIWKCKIQIINIVYAFNLCNNYYEYPYSLHITMW